MRLCVLSHLWKIGVVFLAEETKVYSSVGGRAVLPCSGAKFSRSCAEVNWAKLWMSIVPEPVVCSGRVVTPSKRSSEPRLGADCSLHIDNLEKEDGGTYVCEHISVEPSTALAVSHRVSLHCYLSAFTGLVLCNHSGVKLTWVTERGTELQGDRYSISYKSACHTVLSVVLRATDHQRKWSCQLTEQQEVKTTVSHVTALTVYKTCIFSGLEIYYNVGLCAPCKFHYIIECILYVCSSFVSQ
uniref:Ig-like domain-containing protein n=1 Tax=Scleropages formosus TaxID=113540 RepID=A0A8C9S840_SCLFO